ncbi:hypothetical protein Dimus_038136 [Dionaea muscipula]
MASRRHHHRRQSPPPSSPPSSSLFHGRPPPVEASMVAIVIHWRHGGRWWAVTGGCGRWVRQVVEWWAAPAEGWRRCSVSASIELCGHGFH